MHFVSFSTLREQDQLRNDPSNRPSEILRRAVNRRKAPSSIFHKSLNPRPLEQTEVKADIEDDKYEMQYAEIQLEMDDLRDEISELTEKCSELERTIEHNEELSLLTPSERKKILQANVKHTDTTSLMALMKEKEQYTEEYRILKEKVCDKEIQKLREDIQRSISDLGPILRKSQRIQGEIDDIRQEIDDIKMSKQYDDVLDQYDTIDDLREKITEEMHKHHDLKRSYYELKQREPIDIASAPELLTLTSCLNDTRKSFAEANQRYLTLRDQQIEELQRESTKPIHERSLVRSIYSTHSIGNARTARSVKSSASSRRSARPVVENVGIICVKYFDFDVPSKIIHRMFDRYGKICGIDKHVSKKTNRYKARITFMRKAAAVDAVNDSIGLRYGNEELEVYLYNKQRKVESVEFHLDDTITIEKVSIPPLDLTQVQEAKDVDSNNC